MKKTFICIVIFLIFMGLYARNEASAESENQIELIETVKNSEMNLTNTVALSYKLGTFVNDYSLGLGLTSPWFFKKKCAVRLNLDLAFRNSTWRPYLNLSLALIGGDFMRTANIRLYGGGGPIFLFPLDKNTKKVLFGGEGFFGFEFFISKQRSGLSYFIELGGFAGDFSKKESIVYPMGFMAHTGFRYHFAIK